MLTNQRLIIHHVDATSLETVAKGLASLGPQLENITNHKDHVVVFFNANESCSLEGIIYPLLRFHVLVAGATETGTFRYASSLARLTLASNDEALNSTIHSIKGILQTQRRVATLVAKGGTGKTQVALHFLVTHRELYVMTYSRGNYLYTIADSQMYGSLMPHPIPLSRQTLRDLLVH